MEKVPAGNCEAVSTSSEYDSGLKKHKLTCPIAVIRGDGHLPGFCGDCCILAKIAPTTCSISNSPILQPKLVFSVQNRQNLLDKVPVTCLLIVEDYHLRKERRLASPGVVNTATIWDQSIPDG